MEDKHDEEKMQEQSKRAKLETPIAEEQVATPKHEPVAPLDGGSTAASSGSQGSSSSSTETEKKRSERARGAAKRQQVFR